MSDFVSPHEEERCLSPTENHSIAKEELTQKETVSSTNDQKDCTQLSENIRIFKEKRMSEHALVFEGEKTSVFGILPIVVKLVKHVEIGIAEAKILRKLNENPHSHIIFLFHSASYSDGIRDYTYIALEKCHNDTLRQFVSNRRERGIVFDLTLMLEFCQQLNCGVEYIHEKNIIHKDLKPDNIFLTLDQTKLKIADFGLSQEIEATSEKVPTNLVEFGTKGYRAPETFGGTFISQKTDIFSLGIILYLLLSNGKHPFGSNPDEWNLNVKNNTGIDLSHLLMPNIKTTQHLIKCSIHHELDCRPTIWEVIDHPCWTGKDVECNFYYRSECPPADERASTTDAREKPSLETSEQNVKFLKAIKRIESSIKQGESSIPRYSGSGARPKKPEDTPARQRELMQEQMQVRERQERELAAADPELMRRLGLHARIQKLRLVQDENTSDNRSTSAVDEAFHRKLRKRGRKKRAEVPTRDVTPPPTSPRMHLELGTTFRKVTILDEEEADEDMYDVEDPEELLRPRQRRERPVDSSRTYN